MHFVRIDLCRPFSSVRPPGTPHCGVPCQRSSWGAVCWLYAPPAQAQDLTENVQLSFGILVAPGSGSETWTIDLSDTGSGTAEFVGGTTLTGDYEVRKGSGPPRTIFIDVAPNGTIPGITIGSFTASYDGSVISLPASGQPNPGNGKILKVGATLTIDSTVANGNHLPGITITIIKE